MICAPPVPCVMAAPARENDTGCECAPRSSRLAHRRGGASRCARMSCALRSRAAGAAGTARAGLGATRQSEGLLRVRGRARLRTPGPVPSGRSQPAILPDCAMLSRNSRYNNDLRALGPNPTPHSIHRSVGDATGTRWPSPDRNWSVEPAPVSDALLPFRCWARAREPVAEAGDDQSGSRAHAKHCGTNARMIPRSTSEGRRT